MYDHVVDSKVKRRVCDWIREWKKVWLGISTVIFDFDTINLDSIRFNFLLNNENGTPEWDEVHLYFIKDSNQLKIYYQLKIAKSSSDFLNAILH